MEDVRCGCCEARANLVAENEQHIIEPCDNVHIPIMYNIMIIKKKYVLIMIIIYIVLKKKIMTLYNIFTNS